MSKHHDLHEADGSIKRFCTKCRTIKPLNSGFSHKRKLENGLFEYHGICRDCRVIYSRKRNVLLGHKVTLSRRRDVTSKIHTIDEKIKNLLEERDKLLNNAITSKH